MSQPQDPFGDGGAPRPQPYPHPGPPVYGPPQPWSPAPGAWPPPGAWGQTPAWGQPGPWAAPPPSPAPRRRRRWPWVLGLLALAVVVAAVALPLAVRRTALDPQAVQRDVAAQYQQLRGGGLQLRCDRDMRVEVDRTYRCTGTTDTQGTVRITIRVTGRDGAYTWSDGG
jgi:hypothetical protein